MESRSGDGSTPCRRVFRAVGSVPGLTKETCISPGKSGGSEISEFLCVGEDKGGEDNHALEPRAKRPAARPVAAGAPKRSPQQLIVKRKL